MSEPVVLERNDTDEHRRDAVLAAYRLGYLAGIEDAASSSERRRPRMRLSSRFGDSR